MNAAVKVPIWAKSDARVTVTWNYPDFIVNRVKRENYVILELAARLQMVFAPITRWFTKPASCTAKPKPALAVPGSDFVPFAMLNLHGWGEKQKARIWVKPLLATPIRSFGRQAGVPMSKQQAQKPFDPSTFMAAFDGGVTVSTYGEGQIVFSQGAPADAVFYIQDGKVKLSVVSAQGKEAVVAFLEAGDFCGEGCLAGQLVRMATAMAATDCTIVRVAKPSMIKALHERVEFSEMFMAHLLARNIRVEADLVDQLFNSSEKRLARVLLLLANFGKDGKPEPVLAKISQETLAEMVGTTRSRVSFFMNRFRKLGFVEYNGDLKVHSSLLNVVLYDKPATPA